MDENQNAQGISIYPNPANGKFEISSSQFPLKEIEIYNLYGEKIYQQTVNRKQETVNLNEASGIYFLKLTTEHGTIAKKIILQK